MTRRGPTLIRRRLIFEMANRLHPHHRDAPPPSSELIVHGTTFDLAAAALESPLEKDVGGMGEAICGGSATAVHWLPVGGVRPEFCRQACASPGVDTSFLAVGTCADAGFHNFLGSHSRAGAPGFEGSTNVSDYTSRHSMF